MLASRPEADSGVGGAAKGSRWSGKPPWPPVKARGPDDRSSAAVSLVISPPAARLRLRSTFEKAAMVTKVRPAWRARASITQAGVRQALGAFWIIDGLLKFQPGLANRSQETYSFAMTAMGTRAPMARAILHVGHLLVQHPILWWGIGLVELAIGIGLVAGWSTRMVLGASVVWALSIWVLGEGVEGISAGATSIVTGFPGAALLYALLGVLLWPTGRSAGCRIAEAGPLGQAGAKGTWAVVWLGAAMVQLRPQVGPGALDSTLFIAAGQEPAPLAQLDRAVLGWLTFGHEIWVSAAVAALCALIVLMVVADILPRLALGTAVALSLAFWLVGQNLGGVLSGSGTDLGTAPPLILLAVLLWPRLASPTAPVSIT